LPSGVAGGKSPGTDDGNGDGREAIGVTAGPGAFIGRGASGAAERGGSLVFAARRFGLACFAFALRAGFLAATFFFRAGVARFLACLALVDFFALRFFAMVASVV
jgi:hypothetical protein